MSRALIVGVFAVVYAGCTTNFRPLEARRGVPSKVATANADLEEGTYNMGDAAVWVDATADKTLILGLRLRNDGQSPMQLDLDDVALELRTEDGEVIVLDELEFKGDRKVQPGSTGRGEFIAHLPEGVEVDDLVGFELLWAVENEEGMRITRSSPFRHETWEESQYYY
jgi:hypothetical protein